MVGQRFGFAIFGRSISMRPNTYSTASSGFGAYIPFSNRGRLALLTFMNGRDEPGAAARLAVGDNRDDDQSHA
jgi:hypothetical protein